MLNAGIFCIASKFGSPLNGVAKRLQGVLPLPKIDHDAGRRTNSFGTGYPQFNGYPTYPFDNDFEAYSGAYLNNIILSVSTPIVLNIFCKHIAISFRIHFLLGSCKHFIALKCGVETVYHWFIPFKLSFHDLWN